MKEKVTDAGLSQRGEESQSLCRISCLRRLWLILQRVTCRDGYECSSYHRKEIICAIPTLLRERFWIYL